jgi:hypothetical protein
MKFGDVLGYTGIMAAVLGAVTIVAMLLIPSNL